MRWPVPSLSLILASTFACGGPAVSLSDRHSKGGQGGISSTDAGGTSSSIAAGGRTMTTSRATGGLTSTYSDPGCPNDVTPQIEAECDVFDQSTCPAGEGCYPGVIYPTAPCEPEIYRSECRAAGLAGQWEDCSTPTDCAAGFICVVGGIGTQCQRACDTSDPTSCPKGFFCDAIDLQGIGTCY